MTTIFYSWQSDSPNSTNRNFIEKSLKKALKDVAADGRLEEADRKNNLLLDKDTKGVPGIPPIAEVIFDKISKSAVFVPDLTFVGKAEGDRLLPNPNVLIEYGWALSTLGHLRIIPVMNIAYGPVSAETLPFDMRHLRHPIAYDLGENATIEERSQASTVLTRQLKNAISLVLQSEVGNKDSEIREHTPIPHTSDPSNFLNPGEQLGQVGRFRGAETTISVPNNEHLFLRLIPINEVEPIQSSKAVYDLLSEGGIRPLSEPGSGWNQGRNRHGAFVCANAENRALSLTQVFCNREVWGIDADLIDKEHSMQWAEVEFGYFPISALEAAFQHTLSSYIAFCRDFLKLICPIRFVAGATGVEGYRMTAPPGMNFRGFEKVAGRVVESNIVYEGIIEDYEVAPTVILHPFFEKLWEECGLDPPK